MRGQSGYLEGRLGWVVCGWSVAEMAWLGPADALQGGSLMAGAQLELHVAADYLQYRGWVLRMCPKELTDAAVSTSGPTAVLLRHYLDQAAH